MVRDINLTIVFLSIYLLFTLFVTLYFRKDNQNWEKSKVFLNHIVLETFLLSILFYLTRTPDSDYYLFYFLPIISIAEYRKTQKVLTLFIYINLSFFVTLFLTSYSIVPFAVYNNTVDFFVDTLVRTFLPRWAFFVLIFCIVMFDVHLLTRQKEELEAINDTAVRILAGEDLETRLSTVMTAAIGLLRGKGCKVYLKHKDKNVLTLVAIKGIEHNLLKPGYEISLHKGMAGKVFSDKASLIVNDYKTSQYRIEELEDLFEAVIEAPLLLLGEPIGVIGVFHDSKCRKFIEIDKPTLERLASYVSVALFDIQLLEEKAKKTLELERSQRQLQETISALENTLLGLTHVTGRPLFMVQGALSNIRDLRGRKLDLRIERQIDEHVELGILAARHAELLNRGLMKVLSVGLGSKFTVAPKRIDVNSELQGLCSAMQCLSRKSNLGFRFFQESPTITMDLDSFLYVFYVLVDNAIKYSDPGRTIELGCDKERSLQTYTVKVKNYGLPIDDPSVVFQKFKRGRNAWRYDETGVGLGCWSAREHMRRQGGDIMLETNGNLSVFIVLLPPQEVA